MTGTLARSLVRVSEDLDRLGHRYALVGGLAVSARTEPRFTRDIDIVVAVGSDDEAERLLAELGYVVRAVVEQTAVGRLATARLDSPGEKSAPVIDLLFASSGIEEEVCLRAEEIELVEGVTVRVAQHADLIALKILAEADDREQDRADLKALIKVATRTDLDLAKEALELIEARGYSRGKDLRSRLAHFESTFA